MTMNPNPNPDPNQIYTPPGGPPQGPPPPAGIYEAIGEEGLYQLLDDFYRRLGESTIQDIFPQGEMALKAASEKSADFFIGLLGGPPLYHQRYGPPRLRARHLPFPIPDASRIVWLQCFAESLDVATAEERFPVGLRDPFYAFLESFSTWMVNRAS
jgi:hemoglobin